MESDFTHVERIDGCWVHFISLVHCVNLIEFALSM